MNVIRILCFLPLFLLGAEVSKREVQEVQEEENDPDLLVFEDEIEYEEDGDFNCE